MALISLQPKVFRPASQRSQFRQQQVPVTQKLPPIPPNYARQMAAARQHINQPYATAKASIGVWVWAMQKAAVVNFWNHKIDDMLYEMRGKGAVIRLVACVLIFTGTIAVVGSMLPPVQPQQTQEIQKSR